MVMLPPKGILLNNETVLASGGPQPGASSDKWGVVSSWYGQAPATKIVDRMLLLLTTRWPSPVQLSALGLYGLIGTERQSASQLVASAVDDAADIIVSAGHGALTGDGPYRVASTGDLPGGVDPALGYFVNYASSNNIRLSLTPTDAYAGVYIDLTDQGSGVISLEPEGTMAHGWATHSLHGAASISAYQPAAFPINDLHPSYLAFSVGGSSTQPVSAWLVPYL